MAVSKYKRAWNERTIPLVEEILYNGGSVIEVCQAMGISRMTFYRWRQDKTKTAFNRKIDELLEAAEAWWMRQGRTNLNNRQFNTQLYNLNMVNRFKWNSAQSETTKVVHETKTVKGSIDVDKLIEKANSESPKSAAGSHLRVVNDEES